MPETSVCSLLGDKNEQEASERKDRSLVVWVLLVCFKVDEEAGIRIASHHQATGTQDRTGHVPQFHTI